MEVIWKKPSHMESVIRAYKTLSKIPSIVGGRLNNNNRVTSRWSVRNLDKGRCTHYEIDYNLDDNLDVIAQSDYGVDISSELLTAVSPKESFKAVIREEKDDKDSSKKKFFLEVWSKSSLKHSIDLSLLDLHGDVYVDSEFGSLDWSLDEKQLVYVAEKKLKKSEPFIKRQPAGEKMKADKLVPGEEHIYRQDWGDQLPGKHETVIVVCNVDEEKFIILENIPDSWCPGQIRFSPSGDSVVGVAWDISGVRRPATCTHRRSYIFCASLTGELRKLSPENKSVRSPRFSPSGDLVWLQRNVQGPYLACHQLVKMSKENIASILSSDVSYVTDKISVVIDIVQTSKEISNGDFYGIYTQHLPSKGFSSDGKRLVFSTQQQNEVRSYVVDLECGEIVDISNNKSVAGSTSVLNVKSDIILGIFSNMCTPGQLFAAKLPSAGNEQNIVWKRISTPQVVPSCIADAKLQYMDLKHENCQETVSTFTAIYFGPNEGSDHPLIVWPHGGPHSVFSNDYSLEAAFFNVIGFACILINFRGSAGSGDSSIHFLPGRIGSADVKDCKLATDQAVDNFPINKGKLMLYGGSYGGTLVTHLSGHYPDVYKATVAKNPVIDLASMHGGDIADWCSIEAGLPFQEGGQELDEQLLALRKVSPIVHAHNVKVPTALMLASKDKRVPNYQGIEYSRKLEANGVHTRIYMYEDNHALSSLPVEMDCLINSADWFITHIKPTS